MMIVINSGKFLSHIILPFFGPFYPKTQHPCKVVEVGLIMCGCTLDLMIYQIENIIENEIVATLYLKTFYVLIYIL